MTGPPGRVVERLDEAIMSITDVPKATLIVARATQTNDGHWQLTWTNAGHPPPLLNTRDGLARFLTGGHRLLPGTGVPTSRPDTTPSGSPRAPPSCSAPTDSSKAPAAPSTTA
ncbi:SpoIIE family protein phosphatase [Streptomyces griseofuscus]|uniref:SpoIIE family protein phosphatase n=1 Tax=Streptomyces griseofuscus TaxID=146922 RepID=UPI0037F919CA